MEKIFVNPEEAGAVIPAELHGQFIEFLGSAIYDGIWVGPDSPIPNYDGLRKDTVDALRRLAPPVIRWPGGCYADTYHWRNGIGPADRRPVTYNENFGTFETDSNAFGTHEFMRLCRMVGAQPWLNVNMMTGSAAEMREWMEYCNRRDVTALSRERAANGDPEPFDVELWGIGNEVWSGGGFMTPASYAAEYRKYATACPSFSSFPDPSGAASSGISMKRIASGPDGNKPIERVKWMKDFWKAMGEYRCPPIDGIDLHFYNWNMDPSQTDETQFTKEQWDSVVSGCLELEEVICEQYDLMQEGIASLPQTEGFFLTQRPDCRLIVGEWGNWHYSAFTRRPALYQQCTMRDAVTTALTLDIFHRCSEKVSMACAAQTVNVLNSAILTDGDACILTPNFDVYDMYRVHRNARYLPMRAEHGEDGVYTSASVKEDMVSINLINANMEEDRELILALPEGAEYAGGRILCSSDPHDYNDRAHPDRVRAKDAARPEYGMSGNTSAREENRAADIPALQRGLKAEFRISLPAASIQVLSFRI